MNIADIERGPAAFIGALTVGMYAWLATAAFGLVLLDVTYARLIPDARTAFAEAADLLLLVTAATIVAGICAIGVSWHSRTARNLLTASMTIGFAVPLLVVAMAPVSAQEPTTWGAILRLLLSALSSLLALAGFYLFRRGG